MNTYLLVAIVLRCESTPGYTPGGDGGGVHPGGGEGGGTPGGWELGVVINHDISLIFTPKRCDHVDDLKMICVWAVGYKGKGGRIGGYGGGSWGGDSSGGGTGWWLGNVGQGRGRGGHGEVGGGLDHMPVWRVPVGRALFTSYLLV